jgi:hypothetical protein
MPNLKWSQALTANQRGYNPLLGWQFEFLPWHAVVKILHRTTGAAGTVLEAIYSGSTTIQERGPMQVGGTAGVIPSELNTAPVTFIAAAGDRLKITVDETAGATPTVDGIIFVEPA